MKFVIVNEFDRPFEKHIAELREDGKCYYIHPELKDIECHKGMDSAESTPLEDFGLKIQIDNNKFRGELFFKSTATYKSGKPREWQGSHNFSFNFK